MVYLCNVFWDRPPKYAVTDKIGLTQATVCLTIPIGWDSNVVFDDCDRVVLEIL
jgi:hypothetical protein